MKVHGKTQTPTGRRTPTTPTRLPNITTALQWGVRSPGPVPDPRFREPNAGVKGSSHPVPVCDLTPHPSRPASAVMNSFQGAMNMKPIHAFLLAAILILSPIGAAAQSRSRRGSTENFERSLGGLPPGTELVVQERDGNWTKGRLVSVLPDRLTVIRHKQIIDFQREDIELVWRLTGRKTMRGSEIGAVVGAIAGAVALASFCHDEGVNKNACLFGAIPVGGIFGAGSGYVVGAAVGSTMRRKRIVYYNRGQYTVSPNPPPSEDPFARASRRYTPPPVCQPEKVKSHRAEQNCVTFQ